MFLTAGRPLPDWAYTADPEGLTPLGDAGWPSDVTKSIAELFSRAGIPDPYCQKLVEPTARVFGGKVGDLSKVNWTLAVDYFTWEIESLRGTAKAEALQRAAEDKYGGIFSHYEVYSTDGWD